MEHNQITYYETLARNIELYNSMIRRLTGGWNTSKQPFDLFNADKKAYVKVEVTQQSIKTSILHDTYMAMQHLALTDKEIACYFVDLSIDGVVDKPWSLVVDGVQIVNERIRKISITLFCKIYQGKRLP